jgi:rhodanese-related sulfurtransferase
MPYPDLGPKEAHATLDRFRVIDVRQPHEFHGPLGHIEGAEPIPLGTLAENATLTGERPLLFICRSGVRSGKACEVLQQRGITDVTNLAGGMIGWNRAGLPIAQPEYASIDALLDSIIAWIAQVGPLSEDAAREVVHKRIGEGTPSPADIAPLLDFVADSLKAVNPPDLDLSLAAFRRALAAL